MNGLRGSGRLLLDCCALINLYATHRISDILGAFTLPVAVAVIVKETEALFVGSGARDDPLADYERVAARLRSGTKLLYAG